MSVFALFAAGSAAVFLMRRPERRAEAFTAAGSD